MVFPQTIEPMVTSPVRDMLRCVHHKESTQRVALMLYCPALLGDGRMVCPPGTGTWASPAFSPMQRSGQDRKGTKTRTKLPGKSPLWPIPSEALPSPQDRCRPGQLNVAAPAGRTRAAPGRWDKVVPWAESAGQGEEGAGGREPRLWCEKPHGPHG